MKTWMAPVLLVLFFAKALCAQDCNAILAQGFRNVSSSKSEAAAISMKYYNNCGLDYSSMSDSQLATVEVSVFGYGSGNAGYSRTRREQTLHQWCETNKDYAESHRVDSVEAQDIYAPSVAAWDSCNRLGSNSVQITPTITPDDRTVDLKLKYSGPAKGVMLQKITSDNFTCTFATSSGTRVNLPIALGTNLVNVNCNRGQPTTVTRDGTTYTKLERATISVATAGDNLQLYFPERWDPSLPEAEAARINQQIEDLRLTVPAGTIFAFTGKVPPKGWVLCDGVTVSRTGEYQRLFALFGETYGRGDGSSTFQLPDLRGKFLRGALMAANIGKAGGVSKPSGNVALVQNDWKGSDFQWGVTPWHEGPNPVKAGTYTLSFDADSSIPPEIEISFIIKE